MDNKKKAKLILEKILQSDKILIIPSTPLDKDSIGTALSIEWLLEKLDKKNVKIYIFTPLPEMLKKIKGIEKVTQKSPGKVDFNTYDSIILVDGNSWHQFFTAYATDIVEKIDKSKFIQIDHHTQAQITSDINDDLCINVDDCCAAKIFYDYFIKPSKYKLDVEVATLLYDALIYDTARFGHRVMHDTFEFASKLLNCGIDVESISEETFSAAALKFLEWALAHTKYYPDLQTMILTIDWDQQKEIKKVVGDRWGNNETYMIYNEYILRRIEGYNYGVVFKANSSTNGVRVSWRTRNLSNTLEMQKILESIGFRAGGHRNAGGGNRDDIHINEVEKLFVVEMKKKLEQT